MKQEDHEFEVILDYTASRVSQTDGRLVIKIMYCKGSQLGSQYALPPATTGDPPPSSGLHVHMHCSHEDTLKKKKKIHL